MAQVVDTDSGDIWAALSELAAFDGLVVFFVLYYFALLYV